MDLVVTKLAPADYPLLEELLGVYEEAFGLTGQVWPPAVHLQQLLHHPTMFFLVARTQHHVVGGLTAHILPSVYYQAAEVYLYDLAVKNDWQRQGVGTLLIKELEAECTRLGVKEIFVQADVPDKHAIDFYAKNGGIPEDVIHFSFATK